MQDIDDAVNKILFKLKKHGSEDVISKTACEITLDKKLIGELSKDDLCSISYAAGYEQSSGEHHIKYEVK